MDAAFYLCAIRLTIIFLFFFPLTWYSSSDFMSTSVSLGKKTRERKKNYVYKKIQMKQCTYITNVHWLNQHCNSSISSRLKKNLLTLLYTFMYVYITTNPRTFSMILPLRGQIFFCKFSRFRQLCCIRECRQRLISLHDEIQSRKLSKGLMTAPKELTARSLLLFLSHC